MGFKITQVALGPITSIDLFWHLRLGMDLLEKGWFPIVDYYSVPNQGKAYLWPTPWLFQLMVASVYKINHSLGTLKFLKLFTFLIPIVLALYFYLKKQVNLLGGSFLVLSIYFAILNRPHLRPDLLVYSLSLINVYLYFVMHKEPQRRHYLGFFLTQLVWSVYHSSAVVGLTFFLLSQLFIFYKYHFKKSPSALTISKSLTWIVLVFLTGFANTHLKHWLWGATALNDWVITSDEFKSLWSGPLLGEHYFLIMLFALSLLLFLRNKRLDLVFINSFFMALWLWHERMTAHTLIIVSASLAFFLNEKGLLVSLSPSKIKNCKNSQLIKVLLPVLSFILVLIVPHKRFAEGLEFKHRQPMAVMEYMAKNKLEGPLLTEWGYAAYVMFKRGDKNPVFMDGRTGQLYTPQQLIDFYKMIHQPEFLENYTNQKELPYLLASENFRPDRLLETAVRSKNYFVEYEQDQFYLFSKTSPFIETTKLLSSRLESYQHIDKSSLLAEYEVLTKENSANPNLKNIVQFFLMYSDKTQEQQLELLSQYSKRDLPLTFRRMLAQLALLHQKPQLSLDLYRGAGPIITYGRLDTYRLCLLLMAKSLYLPAVSFLAQISEQHLSKEEQVYFYSLKQILYQYETVRKSTLKFYEQPSGITLLPLKELEVKLLGFHL